VASLFCLSVVEPMMVGACGGGIANIRLADGTIVSIDNYSTSPAASSDTLYTPAVVPTPPRADAGIGLLAVGVPGTH
jgi:gamma-glutamyltranspeptidase/glutathione hydrolase